MNEKDLYSIGPELAEELKSWYLVNKRDLPWRRSGDPYKIWLSEIMLQQTQVATVIPYYERWLKRFPDIQSLAETDRQEVLKYWEGLGYYSRAANLHRGAVLILEKYKGKIPSDHDELLGIPGIGPYTAAAVSSIAFGETQGVVDGNVKRVMARLFQIHGSTNSGSFHKICRDLVEESFSAGDPSTMNQAWMELGAMICQRSPRCSMCPVKIHCDAYLHNRMHEFPNIIRKKAVPLRRGGIFIFRKENRYLLVRRKEVTTRNTVKMLQGLWEFPNTYYDEAPLADFTLANDIIIESSYIQKIKHQYSHFKVEFELFSASIRSKWWNDYWSEYRWVTAEEMKNLPRTGVHIKCMAAAGIAD